MRASNAIRIVRITPETPELGIVADELTFIYMWSVLWSMVTHVTEGVIYFKLRHHATKNVLWNTSIWNRIPEVFVFMRQIPRHMEAIIARTSLRLTELIVGIVYNYSNRFSWPLRTLHIHWGHNPFWFHFFIITCYKSFDNNDIGPNFGLRAAYFPSLLLMVEPDLGYLVNQHKDP